jgi:hypothetical protein
MGLVAYIIGKGLAKAFAICPDLIGESSVGQHPTVTKAHCQPVRSIVQVLTLLGKQSITAPCFEDQKVVFDDQQLVFWQLVDIQSNRIAKVFAEEVEL